MTAPAGGLPERLAELFREALAIEVPSPDTDLLETGRLDSVGVVELVLELETRFGVHVEMDALELDDFRTLRSIAAFVAERRNAASPGRLAG